MGRLAAAFRHLVALTGRTGLRRLALGSATLYLVLYLVMLRNISPGGRGFTLRTTDPGRMFERMGPATFEPVAQITVPGLTVLLSPLNIVVGALLGVLVGVGTMVSVAAVRHAEMERTAGLLVAAATALAGLACLVPGATILFKIPVPSDFVPFFQALIPVSLGLLAGTVAWVAGRMEAEPHRP